MAPAAPKPVRKGSVRRRAADRGKGFEKRVAEKFNAGWQIVARALGVQPGLVQRRLKDATLGYATNADDIDAPLHFPFVIECKKRAELPKTLEKWRDQAIGYDDLKISLVACADTNGSHEQQRVWVDLDDLVKIWTEGWERVLEMREASEPIVAALALMRAGEAIELEDEVIVNFVEVLGEAGSTQRHPESVAGEGSN